MLLPPTRLPPPTPPPTPLSPPTPPPPTLLPPLATRPPLPTLLLRLRLPTLPWLRLPTKLYSLLDWITDPRVRARKGVASAAPFFVRVPVGPV